MYKIYDFSKIQINNNAFEIKKTKSIAFKNYKVGIIKMYLVFINI